MTSLSCLVFVHVLLWIKAEHSKPASCASFSANTDRRSRAVTVKASSSGPATADILLVGQNEESPPLATLFL
jgi:hypothetical protein